MTQAATWNPDSFIELCSYREVDEVLRRGREFVLNGTKAESDEFVHGTLIAIDGSEHMARRRALMKMIRPNQPWGPEGKLLDEIVEQNLARVRSSVAAEDGAVRFDLIDFCKRIIWRVTAAFVGIDGIDDDEQVSRFLALATPVLEGLSAEYAPVNRRDAIVASARAARAQIRSEMFGPSLHRRQALIAAAATDDSAADALPADLLTSLLQSAGDTGVDEEMIFREAIALLAAAVNNPVSQVAWVLDDLLPWLESHPADRGRISEREFLNLAVKETLRMHRSSRPYLVRIAVTDVTLESSGRFIPAGSWVSNRLERANHDRDVFGSDADSYNPYRKLEDDKVSPFGVAFGSGPHVCLGRPMLLWEQGGEDAQGIQTKLLRYLLANDVTRDANGVHELAGDEGGRRYAHYDVTMPASASS